MIFCKKFASSLMMMLWAVNSIFAVRVGRNVVEKGLDGIWRYTSGSQKNKPVKKPAYLKQLRNIERREAKGIPQIDGIAQIISIKQEPQDEVPITRGFPGNSTLENLIAPYIKPDAYNLEQADIVFNNAPNDQHEDQQNEIVFNFNTSKIAQEETLETDDDTSQDHPEIIDLDLNTSLDDLEKTHETNSNPSQDQQEISELYVNNFFAHQKDSPENLDKNDKNDKEFSKDNTLLEIEDLQGNSEVILIRDLTNQEEDHLRSILTEELETNNNSQDPQEARTLDLNALPTEEAETNNNPQYPEEIKILDLNISLHPEEKNETNNNNLQDIQEPNALDHNPLPTEARKDRWGNPVVDQPNEPRVQHADSQDQASNNTETSSRWAAITDNRAVKWVADTRPVKWVADTRPIKWINSPRKSNLQNNSSEKLDQKDLQQESDTQGYFPNPLCENPNHSDNSVSDHDQGSNPAEAQNSIDENSIPKDNPEEEGSNVEIPSRWARITDSRPVKWVTDSRPAKWIADSRVGRWVGSMKKHYWG